MNIPQPKRNKHHVANKNKTIEDNLLIVYWQLKKVVENYLISHTHTHTHSHRIVSEMMEDKMQVVVSVAQLDNAQFYIFFFVLR